MSASFPDKLTLAYVLEGLEYGFDLCYKPGTLDSAKSNSRSARDNSDVVSEYLAEEVQAGSMAGPFATPP